MSAEIDEKIEQAPVTNTEGMNLNMEELRVATYNAQGLSEEAKRVSLETQFDEHRCFIVGLQEGCSKKTGIFLSDCEKYWRSSRNKVLETVLALKFGSTVHCDWKKNNREIKIIKR